MRALCQRVSEARVTVEGAVTGEIGAGLAVFVGIERTDDPRDASELARKAAHLRIFEDERGKFAHSLLDTSGSALVVSQFTLVANSRRQVGTRPDFSRAAPKAEAEPLYEQFCQALRDLGVTVETGVFGERMAVEIINDGPVTIVLDT